MLIWIFGFLLAGMMAWQLLRWRQRFDQMGGILEHFAQLLFSRGNVSGSDGVQQKRHILAKLLESRSPTPGFSIKYQSPEIYAVECANTTNKFKI